MVWLSGRVLSACALCPSTDIWSWEQAAQTYKKDTSSSGPQFSDLLGNLIPQKATGDKSGDFFWSVGESLHSHSNAVQRQSAVMTNNRPFHASCPWYAKRESSLMRGGHSECVGPDLQHLCGSVSLAWPYRAAQVHTTHSIMLIIANHK